MNKLKYKVFLNFILIFSYTYFVFPSSYLTPIGTKATKFQTTLIHTLRYIPVSVPTSAEQLKDKEIWRQVSEAFNKEPFAIEEAKIPATLNQLMRSRIPQCASYCWNDKKNVYTLRILRIPQGIDHPWLIHHDAVSALLFIHDRQKDNLLEVHIIRPAGPGKTKWEMYYSKKYRQDRIRIPAVLRTWWKKYTNKTKKPYKETVFYKKTLLTLSLKPCIGLWLAPLDSENLPMRFKCYATSLHVLKPYLGTTPWSRIEHLIKETTDQQVIYLNSALKLWLAINNYYPTFDKLDTLFKSDPLEVAKKIRKKLTKKGTLDPNFTPTNVQHLIHFATGKHVRYLANALQLRYALLDKYPTLKDLRKALKGDPLKVSEKIRKELTKKRKLHPDFTSLNAQSLIHFATGKNVPFLGSAIQLRLALLDKYPTLKDLRKALEGDPLKVSEKIRKELTKKRKLHSDFTPTNIQNLIHYATGKNVLFLGSAVQLRLALLDKYPTLKDLRKDLEGDPLKIAEKIRKKLTKKGTLHQDFTPANIEHLIHYAAGKNVRFLSCAVHLRLTLLDKYPSLKDLRKVLEGDPLEVAEKIREELTKKGTLHPDFTPTNIHNLIHFATGKDIYFLANAMQLRLALLDKYPTLTDLRKVLKGDPLEVAEKIRKKFTKKGTLHPDFTPTNIQNIIHFATGKDIRFLANAMQLRLALLDKYPTLKDLRKALEGDPLEVAEKIRKELTKKRTLNPDFTPTNIQNLIHFATGKDIRFLANAMQLRLALLDKYPTLKDLRKALKGVPLEVSEKIRKELTKKRKLHPDFTHTNLHALKHFITKSTKEINKAL